MNCQTTPRYALLALVCAACAAVPALGQEPELNRQILKFCEANLGKKMGDGECTGLVLEAYKEFSARKFPNAVDSKYKDEYVWGTPVATLTVKDGKPVLEGKPLPGDILQIRDVKLQGKFGKNGTYTAAAPHHTAVVASLDDDVLTVYEQNVNGKRFVMMNKVNLKDVKEGKISFYRPVAK